MNWIAQYSISTKRYIGLRHISHAHMSAPAVTMGSNDTLDCDRNTKMYAACITATLTPVDKGDT